MENLNNTLIIVYLKYLLLVLMLVMNLQDIVSEHPERFFVGEIVREKIFMQFRNEIPYACQVASETIDL